MSKRLKNIVTAGVLMLGLFLCQQKLNILKQLQDEVRKANNTDRQARKQLDNQKNYFLSI